MLRKAHLGALVASIETIFMLHTSHEGITESSRIILRQVMTLTCLTCVINLDTGQMLNLDCAHQRLSICPENQIIFGSSKVSE